MATERDGGPFRVIGIESDEGLQSLFLSIFNEHHYRYENYSSPFEALRALQQDKDPKNIKAVVLDNHIYTKGRHPPLPSTFSVIKSLRQILDRTPIILVTTDKMDALKKKRYIEQKGISAVLEMPFDDIRVIDQTIRFPPRRSL